MLRALLYRLKILPCKYCHSHIWRSHHPLCTRAAPIRETEHWKTLYEKAKKHSDFLIVWTEKKSEQIVFWQGKFALVKRENNALRRKLTKQGKSPSLDQERKESPCPHQNSM